MHAHIAANAERVCTRGASKAPARFIDIVRIGLPRTGIESILCRQRYRRVNPNRASHEETRARADGISIAGSNAFKESAGGREYRSTIGVPSRVPIAFDRENLERDALAIFVREYAEYVSFERFEDIFGEIEHAGSR